MHSKLIRNESQIQILLLILKIKSKKQNVNNSSCGAFLFDADLAEKSLQLKSFRVTYEKGDKYLLIKTSPLLEVWMPKTKERQSTCIRVFPPLSDPRSGTVSPFIMLFKQVNREVL